VSYSMVQQMSVASAEFPEGVNEFEKSGFTPIPSDLVRPFRVAESPVQMECRINDIIPLGTEGGAGNLVVCEILRLHLNEDILDSEGKISPTKLDAVARLNGNWYSRAKEGLFELAQPTTNLGIGFDQLPADVRNSKILSGNDLGKLASVQSLPDETSVNEFKLIELSDLFMEFESDPRALEEKLHQRAKELLEENKINEAWMTLLTYNN
jgi:hypothetical protein